VPQVVNPDPGLMQARLRADMNTARRQLCSRDLADDAEADTLRPAVQN